MLLKETKEKKFRTNKKAHQESKAHQPLCISNKETPLK